MHRIRPPKNLSPSFEEAGYRKDVDHFDVILPSIEYSLGMFVYLFLHWKMILRSTGRLMYTSGDTEGALRYFLGLLKGSSFRSDPEQDFMETDALYLGDFKVAFEVWFNQYR